MDKLDGSLLNGMKRWQCDKNKDHTLGVIERVKVKLQVDGTTLRYFTSRLIVFRQAVDMSAEIPQEIEVAGTLDGKMLSMVWICSVPGCGCIKEWHPNDELLEYMVKTYLAE